MPKTQYFTAASLDGFIADSGNSLDWLFQAEATAKAESASGDLYHEFDHGLLDEMIISIAPATLGSGAPLLPRRLLPGELTLTSCADDGTFVHLSYSVSRPGR